MILEAACTCLSKKGAKGFNLRNVANEAGVSIGLIGRYFEGIDDLLQSVLDTVMVRLPPRVGEAANSLPEAVHKLQEIIANSFSPDYYSRDNLLVWLPIYEAMMLDKTLRTKLLAQDQRYIDEIATHIRKVAEFRGLQVNADRLAENFFSYLDGLWLRWCFLDRSDTLKEQDSAYAFLESALGPLRTPDATR